MSAVITRRCYQGGEYQLITRDLQGIKVTLGTVTCQKKLKNNYVVADKS